MARKSIGLESIYMGAIAGDGGMGTVLTQIGATVSDSAALTTEEGTTTDFNIEESDAPFFSIQSSAQKQTLGWSSYDVDLDTMARFYGGTVTPAAAARIATLGAITPGSAYTNGTYNNVPLTGGAGSGATANITVAGGVVTAVVIVARGINYVAGNSLSALAANMGGTGSGFAVLVATVETTTDSWAMPDTLPVLERSLKITTKDGWKIEIPRASLTTKMQWNLQKTKLAQLDITAVLLAPTKAGLAKATFYEPAV